MKLPMGLKVIGVHMHEWSSGFDFIVMEQSVTNFDNNADGRVTKLSGNILWKSDKNPKLC